MDNRELGFVGHVVTSNPLKDALNMYKMTAATKNKFKAGKVNYLNIDNEILNSGISRAINMEVEEVNRMAQTAAMFDASTQEGAFMVSGISAQIATRGSQISTAAKRFKKSQDVAISFLNNYNKEADGQNPINDFYIDTYKQRMQFAEKLTNKIRYNPQGAFFQTDINSAAQALGIKKEEEETDETFAQKVKDALENIFERDSFVVKDNTVIVSDSEFIFPIEDMIGVDKRYDQNTKSIAKALGKQIRQQNRLRTSVNTNEVVEKNVFKTIFRAIDMPEDQLFQEYRKYKQERKAGRAYIPSAPSTTKVGLTPFGLSALNHHKPQNINAIKDKSMTLLEAFDLAYEHETTVRTYLDNSSIELLTGSGGGGTKDNRKFVEYIHVSHDVTGTEVNTFVAPLTYVDLYSGSGEKTPTTRVTNMYGIQMASLFKDDLAAAEGLSPTTPSAVFIDASEAEKIYKQYDGDVEKIVSMIRNGDISLPIFLGYDGTEVTDKFLSQLIDEANLPQSAKTLLQSMAKKDSSGRQILLRSTRRLTNSFLNKAALKAKQSKLSIDGGETYIENANDMQAALFLMYVKRRRDGR